MTIRLFALFCAVLLTIGSAMQKHDDKRNDINTSKISIFKKINNVF